MQVMRIFEFTCQINVKDKGYYVQFLRLGPIFSMKFKGAQKRNSIVM